MNLVTLSEQLKDVPDQFLQKEVTNPTGSYPAYLVVSEMTRRARMRDRAQKNQEPRTTVVEDVSGLNTIPQAALSLAGRDAMQMGVPPQINAPQPPMPQPSMPPQPPASAPQMMADGGLVAFQKGGEARTPFEPRSEFDILIDEYIPESVQAVPRTLMNVPGLLREKLEQFTASDPRDIEESQKREREITDIILDKPTVSTIDPAKAPQIIRESDTLDTQFISNPELRKQIQEGVNIQDPAIRDALIRSSEGRRLESLTPKEVDSRIRKKMETPPTLKSRQSGSLTGLESIQAKDITDIAGDSKKDSGKKPASQEDANQVQNQALAARETSLVGSPAYKALQTKLSDNEKAIIGLLNQGKTNEEIIEDAESDYRQNIKNPAVLMEENIEKEKQRIKNLDFENINNALITMGAAILQAPGGKNLKWLGKGLEDFQKAYSEGRKDIIDAKKDLFAAEMEKLKADNLYELGEQDAGDKAIARFRNLRDDGLKKLTTERALFTEKSNTLMAMEELSIKKYEAKTERDFREAYAASLAPSSTELSSSEFTAASTASTIRLAREADEKGLKPGTQAYKDLQRRIENEEFARVRELKSGMGGLASIPQAPRTFDFSSMYQDPLLAK